MGRHTAPDGDAVHPVVAAALARRAAGSAAQRDDAMEEFATQRIDGNVGWPGEPPAPGGGLGWPGELPRDSADPSADEELDEDLPEHQEEPAARRRGWRRLLGVGRAA